VVDATAAVVAAKLSVQDEFFRGFDAYATRPYDREHITRVITCESRWVVDPGGYHLGLAQFDPGTWARVGAVTGGVDYFDPYSQGANMAAWIGMIEEPGGSGGWPYCWWN